MPHTSSFHFKLENCSPNYRTHAMQALANSRFECPFKPIVRDFSYSKEKEERKNFTQLNSIYIYIHQFGDENQNDRREYLIRRMGTSVGVIARLRRNTHMDYNILFTILPQFNWIQRNFKEKSRERKNRITIYPCVCVRYAVIRSSSKTLEHNMSSEPFLLSMLLLRKRNAFWCFARVIEFNMKQAK